MYGAAAARRMQRDGQYELSSLTQRRSACAKHGSRQRRSLQLLHNLERCGSPLTANHIQTVDLRE
jgi:hypothetical protein